jgi:PKD repeat protein
MKNIVSILLFIVLALTRGFSQVCCPDFEIRTEKIQSCNESDCYSNEIKQRTNIYNYQKLPQACKNLFQQYLVVPNDPIFTYNWNIIGGTVDVNPDNPAIVHWGNSQVGIIEVIITNADGSCLDTIIQEFCLIDGPTAIITANPNPVCLKSTVQFNGSSSIGATEFNWDFGDGSYSNLQNPDHEYNTSGTFPVVLTVSNKNREGFECGCIDTAIVLIEVIDSAGIDIHTDDCRKMLCTNDTVVYCTNTPGCTNLYWNVNGGTLLSGQGDTCITVTWDQPSVFPTSVTLTANCPGTCGNSATLNVPVLYPNLPMQGQQIVCPRSRETYSLPALPGTFYDWTISGGGTIENYDHNINFISVNWWASSGNYQIICNYNNPYSGCSGGDTIVVKIRPKFSLSGLSPICVGDSAVYCASDSSTRWSVNPVLGWSITLLNSSCQRIKWEVAGNYSVTAFPVNATNFCNDSATMNVVVNPTPVLNPITGPDTICPEQLYNYSVSSNVDGGRFEWKWVSGTGYIYPYGPNDSLASVIFSGTGPWTLQATQTVNRCHGSKTLTVTKVPSPPSISLSIDSICSGGTITASVSGAIPPGGYTWSCTPGAVLMSGQGTTSATFVVNDSAQITISSCGGSKMKNVKIITASVAISQSLNTCSATLTATPVGGFYSWFLNGDPAGSTNPITVTQNGTYVVRATYGSCTADSQITVTGITPVIASISSTGDLCDGGVVTLHALVNAVCPGANFTWSNGATGSSITVNTPDSYSVTVSCSNGCSDVSNIIHVRPCLVGPGSLCINDLTISGNNNCNNPINLSASAPGCTPTGTTWYYGDGFIGSTGTHHYTNAGAYSVYAEMVCTDGSHHCDSVNILVPMVDSITSVVSCGTNAWNIQLQDASLYLSAYSGYLRTWSTTCGYLSAINISNPVLTVPFGCNPVVTQTISKNGCVLNHSVIFDLPDTTFDIVGSNSVCIGSNFEYNSSFTTNIISYNWNFGDYTTGVTNPITHAFNGTPPNPTIKLNITDSYGCVFDATKLITVNIPALLTISPSPVAKICPDCLPPSKLRANPSIGFSDFQWIQNGNDIVGAIDSIYQLCNFNASGNYFVKATDASINCPVTSDTVQVVYQPKPVADIQGNSIQCMSGTVANFDLTNSIYDSIYDYFWTVTPIATILINRYEPHKAHVSVSDTGTYQFILTVKDTSTHCIAIDTFCVYVYINPTVTVVPSGYFCEGINHTFTAIAIPSNPDYLYHWSNGATGNPMTTSQAGVFSVTVTDPVSGCFGRALTGLIKERPYVELFPLGCDTICDSLINTTVLIPPLPTDSFPPNYGYYNNYTINWYDNDTLIYTGWDLPLSMLPTPILGQHHINIEVNFSGDSCVSTSGYYDLVIVPCYCDCEPSRFLDLYWSDNNNHEEEFCCGSSFEDIACNNPLTFHAEFQCDTVTCNNPVSYSLFTGGSFYSNGIMPFSTAGLPDGSYTLMMFGKCGDIICDTCIVIFKIDCPCCPQEDEIIIVSGNKSLLQQTYLGNNYSLFTTEVSIAGGTTPYTQVRADVIDFQLTANYNDCIDCSNLPFTWASLGATSLSGINPTTTGATPTVGYFVPSNRFGNPREVVWNNGMPIDLSSTQNIKLLIYLPPLSKIPCCALKAKVCVKFSFYDINCNLCEKVECYDIILGETTSHEVCCCDKWDNVPVYIYPIKSLIDNKNKDVIVDSEPIPEPFPFPQKGTPVKCGGSIKLKQGKYLFKAPMFHCNPTTCNTAYSWTVRGGSSYGRVDAHGVGNSFSFDFQMPGSYTVTLTPKCGDCECQPCTFTLIVKKKCIF